MESFFRVLTAVVVAGVVVSTIVYMADLFVALLTPLVIESWSLAVVLGMVAGWVISLLGVVAALYLEAILIRGAHDE